MLSKFRLFTCIKHKRKFSFVFCRLRSRYLILNIAILTFVLIVIINYLFDLTVLCSAWQVTAAVNVLCELYKKGEVAGNLCHDLCVTGAVRLGSCQTQHLAKEVVFEAKWNDVNIVIKSDYLDFKNYDNIGLKTSFESVQYPTVAEFSQIVTNHIRINLNVNLDNENVLKKLWSADVDELLMQSSLPSIMNSIWSLIQQNEYILMKSFEEKKVFPRVVGSCGHFYAVEFIKPLTWTDWPSRLRSALKLVDFSNKLEHNFHEPLHLCDIKNNHFGVDSEMNVRVLDADTAYFKSVIDKMVSSGKNCDDDADCSFWDCQSKCHSEKKMCTQGVSNNNLQVICEKIFLGRSSHSIILKPFENGLLIKPRSANKEKEILKLLEDCVKLNNSITKRNTYTIFRNKLMLYLERDLQQQQQLSRSVQ